MLGPEDSPRREHGTVLRPPQVRTLPLHGLEPCASRKVIFGKENAFKGKI